MALSVSQEQLELELGLVNELITDLLKRRVVKGQFNGREYTLHNLNDLKKYRDDLVAELARISAGGIRVRSVVPGP